jgi:glycine/D-amino acid oxidase-like deaminating enzyme
MVKLSLIADDRGNKAAARSAEPLPPSLWAATATPAPSTPPLHGETQAEVAIVGGGYTGLSAALHLAERGKAVVLLEAMEPGWGASGRNGGQVIPGLKHDPDELCRLLGERQGERVIAVGGGAPDLVFELIARHGIACDAARNGWIQAVHGQQMLAVVQKRAAQWQARGAPAVMLDGTEVAAALGASGYVGGMLDRRGGCLQPLSYARGLARAAARLGASVHGGSPATALHHESGGWRVETPAGAVKAESLILCTNAYTGGLVPGLRQSIVPVNSFQVATAPLPAELRRAILPGGEVASDTRRLLTYFRFDRDGRFLLGGRGSPTGDADPRRYGRLRRLAARLFPQLGNPQWQFHWSGKVAVTVDHLPHVHEPHPGFVVALGYNGRGVAMATMMGKLLAERVLGAPAEWLGLPVTPIQPLPLWSFREPVLALLTRWYAMRDAVDRR